MKKFFLHIILVAILSVVLFVVLIEVSSAIVSSRNFKNYETEGNVLVLKENEHYDIALLGISHARNFSRDKNHLRIEKILNKKVLNLGQGYASCGVNDQLFYLEYFYSKNVKIDTVVYILSPPLLYGDYLNQATSTFNFEPFSFDFFRQYLEFEGADNKSSRLLQYVSSKLHPRWLLHFPKSSPEKKEKLFTLDTAIVNAGFKMAYLEGENLEIFTKNCKQVERTINVARANHSNLIFIIPPALFGQWKGHNETIAFCEKMKAKYKVNFYDLSESILIPEYYYDHHHLNSAGVSYFTEKYLAPIFHP